jgi:alpha-tubulin suppressor-like RCC1 family protein
VPACWGANEFGQAGNGVTLPPPPQAGDPPPPDLRVNVPTSVVGLTGVTAVGTGIEHNCAVGGAGAVSCWGRNQRSQLGDGLTTNSSTPRSVTSLSGMQQVAGGDTHTCAMRSNGTAVCWGDNTWGKLGTNDPTSSTTPRPVVGL